MTSIWHKNGYLCIPVTQACIDESLERNSSHCANALAIERAIPDARHICVDLQTIRFSRRGLRYVFLTPHPARSCIIAVDQGERAAIVPFDLKMRPAFIAKSGKKRTHTPSNAELRGTGLTVNKTQLHIDDHETAISPAGKSSALNRRLSKRQTFEEAWRNTGYPPQRFTENGERNLSPDRTDGLFVPPPPPPRTRVARARVSTAHKGSIPTTLGGKLPGISVLSRREFGLRVLRK